MNESDEKDLTLLSCDFASEEISKIFKEIDDSLNGGNDKGVVDLFLDKDEPI